MNTGRVRAAVAAVAFAVLAAAACGAWTLSATASAPFAPAFALADADGHRISLAAERGHAVALSFGYAHCPDVCPTTLASLARAKRMLGAAGRGVAVIFVSVDPERDTPASIARFAHLFDPSFIGLSGSESDLAPVYAAYHVYRQRIPGDNPASYEMAHSSMIQIIGADGRLRSRQSWDAAPGALAIALRAAQGAA